MTADQQAQAVTMAKQLYQQFIEGGKSLRDLYEHVAAECSTLGNTMTYLDVEAAVIADEVALMGAG